MPGTGRLVLQRSLLAGVAIVDLTLDELLCGHQSGLGQTLVETADLNLLAVFESLVKSVGGACKLLQLLVELRFDVGRNLVGALAYNGTLS